MMKLQSFANLAESQCNKGSAYFATIIKSYKFLIDVSFFLILYKPWHNRLRKNKNEKQLAIYRDSVGSKPLKLHCQLQE